MLFHQQDLDVHTFLTQYWQREPLLIRQAFPGFEPELDIDDIAGLACEDLAESRLVTGTYPEHDWTLRHGPFEEKILQQLPGENWTLLVQDVEKHYPPLRKLYTAFSFLPRWRIDDLMVSVAAPGGSVGPHVDQYDVFLLQAAGRRKWQISTTFVPDLLPGTDLNVLGSFEPEQEWILEPGDMLYLPPNVAHHGIALDTGMTWSFGLRAPSSADLLLGFGEWLADRRSEGERYRDGPLEDHPRPGEIDETALSGLADMASRSIESPSDFRQFAGAFLSRYRLAHEPVAPPSPVSTEVLRGALAAGALLRHNPWTRLLWVREKPGAVLFAAGNPFPCSIETASALCTDPVDIRSSQAPPTELIDLARDLLNSGHLYLESATSL